MNSPKPHDYLKRLPDEYYRGQAYVHWSMTMNDRKTGWLVPIFYYKFREILTHTAFRFGLCCPIYCCMPDHIHLLWVGILDDCDQRLSARYFRKQLNPILEKLVLAFSSKATITFCRGQSVKRPSSKTYSSTLPAILNELHWCRWTVFGIILTPAA